MAAVNTHSSPRITAVITAHREGIIAGITARSAIEAIEDVIKSEGVLVELLVILDNADALTAAVLKNALGERAKFHETREGDPGLARNRAAELATGDYIAFLDADDLWSFNWLTEAYRFVNRRPDAVAHSACNIIFGQEQNIWWHIDSESSYFDPQFLDWSNYWDAMAFSRTEIYRRFPFRANNLRVGFGHEDWHWNCVTLAAGIPHKPVPNTVHYKRRRKESQSALVNVVGGTVWPLSVDA